MMGPNATKRGQGILRAVGIFSGGLDSILAVRVLQEQGIDPLCVTFVTPFFDAKAAVVQGASLGIQVETQEITSIYMEVLKNPHHGYGSNMNPCIDCHALMFRLAGEIMERQGALFLFSGEVLGERPFSQTRGALRVVARESGYEGRILRPLSARLLDETVPEKEGWVDRSRLLDLQGKSRKRQMELAKGFGITGYPQPAGGCRLTEPNFAKRLRDLLRYDPDPSIRDLELLKMGRHLRWSAITKIIVGRNHDENEHLQTLSVPEDCRLWVEGFPGPMVLVRNLKERNGLLFAAQVAVRYSDVPPGQPCTVYYLSAPEAGTLSPVVACPDEEIRKYLL
jgi:tRNA U34 2-thiouridine synthase MnmA/TrmU